MSRKMCVVLLQTTKEQEHSRQKLIPCSIASRMVAIFISGSITEMQILFILQFQTVPAVGWCTYSVLSAVHSCLQYLANSTNKWRYFQVVLIDWTCFIFSGCYAIRFLLNIPTNEAIWFALNVNLVFLVKMLLRPSMIMTESIYSRLSILIHLP